MKMNYHHKSKVGKDGKTRAAFFVLIFLGIIFLFHILLPGFWPGTFHTIALPFLQAENSFEEGGAGIFAAFYQKKKLIDKIENLERELEHSHLERAEIKLLKDENKELRELLGKQQEIQGEVIASVIVKPPQTLYDTFLIDSGENGGIKVGSIVFSGDHAYLGKIVEVYPSSAKARFFSSSGEKLSVTLGTSTTHITLEGKGGGNFEARLPKEIPIEKGDYALIPGTHSIVAILDTVEVNVNDSFQTLLFRTPVNLFGLKWVTVEAIENL